MKTKWRRRSSTSFASSPWRTVNWQRLCLKMWVPVLVGSAACHRVPWLQLFVPRLVSNWGVCIFDSPVMRLVSKMWSIRLQSSSKCPVQCHMDTVPGSHVVLAALASVCTRYHSYVFVCRKPTTTTGKGMYELKVECYKEYSPFFYHYTRAEQSKVGLCLCMQLVEPTGFWKQSTLLLWQMIMVGYTLSPLCWHFPTPHFVTGWGSPEEAQESCQSRPGPATAHSCGAVQHLCTHGPLTALWCLALPGQIGPAESPGQEIQVLVRDAVWKSECRRGVTCTWWHIWEHDIVTTASTIRGLGRPGEFLPFPLLQCWPVQFWLFLSELSMQWVHSKPGNDVSFVSNVIQFHGMETLNVLTSSCHSLQFISWIFPLPRLAHNAY